RWLRANRSDVFRGQLSQDFMRKGAHTGKGTHVDIAATILVGNAVTRPDFVAYRWSDASEPVPMLATSVLGACYVGWTLHSVDELLACERRGGIGIFEGFVPDAVPTH
ncbi:MAG: glycerophosphodiester phosphodiesterase, partial [Coriobacteriaceae bacterium]|nr:glycerophosphodiester phosphodiesterase [Coriobacteriaceae bacterium]